MNNEHMHGFTKVRSAELPEISATLHEYLHDATGLKLVWLERPDDNMSFAISFETLPQDDTGVFHILEHSVLCGSDSYPVKEPFVELLKSSMNTFLNAITFPDKTMYPISSRNKADYLNLTKVYLDAVFHPLIASREEIFMQEGWHYHFDENGNPAYQGVVFNEMKGSYADPDEAMSMALNRGLFPDTCYRFESGGDPACIPNLTYENFISAYKRFYSPSNAYVFLDGDIDLDATLAVIQDCVGQLSKGERLAPPAMQAPVKAPDQTVEYEISPDEDEAKRTRVAWGMVVGGYDEREKLIAAEVLAETICGSYQSALTRAVLDEGLAEDVSLSVQTSVAQPWFKLELKNIAPGQQARAEQVVFDTLKKLSQGMDHDQLLATMANVEFHLRERDYGGFPTGLVFCLTAMDTWLYGGLPEANLTVGTVFEELRAKLDQGYFENLIKELMLDSQHCAKVTLKPSHTAGEKRSAAEKARLDRECAAWTSEQKRALMDKQARLIAHQSAEDTPENLATIPQLKLSDIDATPEDWPTEVMQAGGRPLLYHPINAGGIVYVNLYFDADGLTETELHQLSLLCDLTGNLKTSAHTGEQVMNLKRLLIGHLGITPKSFQQDDDPARYTTRLCVGFNALERNVLKAVKLVCELLTDTSLDDESMVLDLLRQKKNDLQEAMVMGGHAVAMGRVSAQTTQVGVEADCLTGYSMFQWLKDTEAHFDYAALKNDLTALRSRIIRQGGLTMSVTCIMTDDVQAAMKELPTLIPAGESMATAPKVTPYGLRREGIVIPADVSFAVLSGDLRDAGCEYNGALQVLGSVVSLGYLWNVIRVQGGAYGTGMRIGTSGKVSCYSYRDPSGAQSLNKYLGSGAFLRDMCAQQPDLTGFIIGAVAEGSPLMTPRTKGATADSMYFRQLSYDTRLKRRQELLSTTAEQLTELSHHVDKALASGGVCVVGGQAQIDACGDMDIVNTL